VLSRRMMTPPRFTLSIRMLLESRGGSGEMVRGGCGEGLGRGDERTNVSRGNGGCCERAKVSRGCEGCGIGVAPGTMRPPNGDDGMLLMFVSRG
jgi:hypothetical protein